MMNVIYRGIGGAIGSPDVPALEIAAFGPNKTCFCCARWASSIWARSTSKSIGATNIADELKKNHVSVQETEYNSEMKKENSSQFLILYNEHTIYNETCRNVTLFFWFY